LIIEQLDGFIVDFPLYENKITDTNKLRGRLGKINAEVQAIGADRGFHCKAISNELGKSNIFNGICPRSTSELIEKRRDPQFCKLQTRRSKTEGRIAAVKDLSENYLRTQDLKINNPISHGACFLNWDFFTTMRF
jgi:hypothetical protein